MRARAAKFTVKDSGGKPGANDADYLGIFNPFANKEEGDNTEHSRFKVIHF